MAETAPEIIFKVMYQGQNITADISNSLISLDYTDNVKDKADELEITLDDTEKKWRNEWAPKKKDVITASVGFPGNMLECGTFEVDEKTIDGPPCTIKIRAVANGATKTTRTKNSKAHEGKTLRQIAQSICDTHGYTLDVGTHIETKKDIILEDINAIDEIRMALFKVLEITDDDERITTLTNDLGPKVGAVRNSMRGKGFETEAAWTQDGWHFLAYHYTNPGCNYYINRLLQVENLLHKRRYEFRTGEQTKVVNNNLDIVITRSTQNKETDLAYLTRIAAEYGFAFNIKGKHMIFYNIKSLEGRPASVKLTESQLTKYSITDKLTGTFSDAVVKHHNPKTKTVITATANAYDEPLWPIEALKVKYRPEGFGVLKDQGFAPRGGDIQKEDYSNDTLQIKSKAENKQQAEAKAKSALHEANSNCCSGSFDTPFNILCCAGNNAELTELGEYSGVYHINAAKFNITKGSGGTVSCEVKRVGFVAQKKKSKKKDVEF